MNLYDRIPNNVNLAEDKNFSARWKSGCQTISTGGRRWGPTVFKRKTFTCAPQSASNRRLGQLRLRQDARLPLGYFPEARRARRERLVLVTTWATCLPGSAGGVSQFPAPHHRHPGDTEPASVEQQRELGKTCPSLYDLRNLFQVNVEEGRHLWAMVYLLHRYFGRDGRDEADALLERRSGNPDKPRILEAFNQPCDDWLNFFCFTMFTDRDGKYQLSALAESGFEPLARTCQFMLTEEAHHMFVGDTGINRVVKRTAQLMKEGDVRALGGIPLDIIQST
jgi:hypothetical protein